MSSETDNNIAENKQEERNAQSEFKSDISEEKLAVIEKIIDLIPPTQLNKVFEKPYLHLVDLPPKAIKTSLGYLFPTEYNRLGEIYRFPATARYFHNNGEEISEHREEQDAIVDLEFENSAKEAFGHYSQMYYGNNALVNTFAWHPSENKLAVVLIIKKGIP